jgi:hypothetical protein
MRHLNIVLKDGLCRPCNTDWLAPIEDRVKPILLPMMLGERAVVLDAAAQALLSFWAVKTAACTCGNPDWLDDVVSR